MRARGNGTSRPTTCAWCSVCAASVSDWDWEVSAQRGRSETDQSGDKSMGWVRTDLLQNEINAGRYNPFGGTINPDDVINAITTSVIRRGRRT